VGSCQQGSTSSTEAGSFLGSAPLKTWCWMDLLVLLLPSLSQLEENSESINSVLSSTFAKNGFQQKTPKKIVKGE
jgi:hypothetical protein